MRADDADESPPGIRPHRHGATRSATIAALPEADARVVPDLSDPLTAGDLLPDLQPLLIEVPPLTFAGIIGARRTPDVRTATTPFPLWRTGKPQQQAQVRGPRLVSSLPMAAPKDDIAGEILDAPVWLGDLKLIVKRPGIVPAR